MLAGDQYDIMTGDALCFDLPSFCARVPVESELPFDHVAAHLVESHVHGLGALMDNGVAGDSHGGGIISLDGRLPLGPFNFYESLLQGYHILGSDKKRG